MPSARLKQLDVLRAVAVLMVIAHHCFYNLTHDYPWLLRAFVSAARRVGWTGVDMFFVLSGFLVSGLLFREHQKHGRINLGRFFVRRGLKIYPAFYFFLLVTGLSQFASGISAYPWGEYRVRLMAELLFVQNYLRGLWGHTWSLAIEEHFYLACGVGLYLLSKRARGVSDPFTCVPIVFGAVAALVLVLRCVTYWLNPAIDDRVHYFPTHLRVDSLAFGVLLAYLYAFHAEQFASFVLANRKRILVLSILLTSVSLAAPKDTATMVTIGYSLLYLGFGGIMLLCVHSRHRFWSSGLAAILALIGSHSYSIYLWHLLVAQRAESVLSAVLGHPVNWYTYSGVYSVVSICLGIVMAKLVEYPVLGLRDKFFPSRASAVQ